MTEEDVKSLFVDIPAKSKSNQKSNQKVVDAIRSNPGITIREMQEATGLSESGVKKVLRRLREVGIISRVGADRGGYWKVD